METPAATFATSGIPPRLAAVRSSNTMSVAASAPIFKDAQLARRGLAAQPVAPQEFRELGQAAVLVGDVAGVVDQRAVAVLLHAAGLVGVGHAQAGGQLVHGDGLVLAVAQPGAALVDHALPESSRSGQVAVVGVDLHPDGQLGATVENCAQGRERVVAVGQVQIAVPADHDGLQVFRMRARRVLAGEGGRLVQPRGAGRGDVRELLRAFGATHVFAVIVEFLADGAVQIVQLQGGIGRPRGPIEVALPASQLVVDLVVADGGLRGVQLFDADLVDVAGLGLQIGGAAG
ncbi:hypothetical protein G6F68_011713 [Rhizopus microsporus]|nr:hypothetical protein G6F68_011713 [Rhizopus microsporus]